MRRSIDADGRGPTPSEVRSGAWPPRRATMLLVMDPDVARARRLAAGLAPPNDIVLVASAREALAAMQVRVPYLHGGDGDRPA